MRFISASGLLEQLCLLTLAFSLACAGGDSGSSEAAETPLEAAEQAGEMVEPPFEVAGEAEGLILTFYDDEGPHTVHNRGDVPVEHRERVRVDSLDLAPDQREPNHVYVADLSAEVEGRYAVRRFTRAAFDALLDEASGVTAERQARAARAEAAQLAAVAGGDDVIIYGASWCGACRSAARYLSQRGVPFEEKDIERDQGARAEMQNKARAAGVRTRGIPVIDFRGTILAGFDRQRIETLLRDSPTRTL